MTIDVALKNDHETLRSLLRRLSNDDPRANTLLASIRAEWLSHTEAREAVVDGGVDTKELKSVRSSIESILDQPTTNTEIARDLEPLLEREIAFEHSQLLPVLRATYSKDERVELAEIFSEVKSEIRDSLAPKAEQASWFQPLLAAFKMTRAQTAREVGVKTLNKIS